MINLNHINDFTLESFIVDCEATLHELEAKQDTLEESYAALIKAEPEDWDDPEWEKWSEKETALHKELNKITDQIEGLDDLIYKINHNDLIDLLKWVRWQEDIIE